MILNLFDNNQLYAQARIIENVRTKCVLFGETLIIRAKTFKQTLPENCSKSTKMATTVWKFSKIFWGSMSPYPPRSFFIFNMFQNNSSGKNALENMSKIGVPFLKNF